MKTAVLTLSFVAGVSGHGIFWKPTSRAQIAQNSGWEADATKIIAEPMPDVATGRPYPGARPFAEPGKSISNIGPCGMETYDSKKTNWNHPENSWGPVQAVYKQGEVVELEWCVSNQADHGGIYSYRMCSDDSIVAKFIDANYTPNNDDFAALENCFQAGILKCSDVPGQTCAVHSDCAGTGWGCEKAAGSWFNCDSINGGRCRSKGVGSCTTHEGEGSILRDKVKMPNFSSNHTLIGFRWDCADTPQLWVHCADVTLN